MTPTEVLEQIADHDKGVLARLMELYLHDLSEFDDDLRLNVHGMFGYRWLDHYWTDEGRFPYFIRSAGDLAGFALVRESAGEMSMAEFFIRRGYRKSGLSRSAAAEAFLRHPGPWNVQHSRRNEIAANFWPKVIASVSRGPIERTELPDGDIIYSFVVPN